MSLEKVYITTKVVKAIPCTKRMFQETVRTLQFGEVKYDEPGYKVTYQNGYVSWCPKDEFEKQSRELSPAEIKMLSI